MPVYVFRCTGCGAQAERLLPLGDTGPRPCDDCGGQMRHRLARVAVRYGAWGFAATDGLVREPGRHDFSAVRERAEQISDES